MSRIQKLIPTVLKSSNLRYWNMAKALFGTSLVGYWPMWETSGVTNEDISGNGRNGTYRNTAGVLNGVTLGQTGIGDGKTAATFDGAAGFSNIYSASLNTGLNTNAGFMLTWVKVPEAAWTNGAVGCVAAVAADANNFIRIQKDSANNQISPTVDFGGTIKGVNMTNQWMTGWFQIGITWDKAADRVRTYLNGLQFGADATGLGTWAGALANGRCCIGARLNTGVEPFLGTIAHVMLGNREATAAEVETLYRAVPGTRFTVIGDSIAAALNGWAHRVVNGYTGTANSFLINRAVSGKTIMIATTDNLDDQVSKAANDRANKIIIEIGTNDDNTGNMTALQAEVEENLAELKASNPGVAIYYINILPRWTDNTGATPVDKSNIRAAIAAACTSQGVTCWDTFTTPWITAADTSDGLHPTAAGHAKIATEVLARL